MTDDPQKHGSTAAQPPATPRKPSVADEQDRAAILERRNRFVAAALAGLAGASLAAGCGELVAQPEPCLSIAAPDANAPQPCLTPPRPEDAGSDVTTDAGDAANDARPQPCLDIAFDAGPLDATPQPCLSPLPPDSGGGSDSGGG